MKQHKLVIVGLFASMCLSASPAMAQAEPDTIPLENDQFQNTFYEALKQKGIGNYDRAITSLEISLKQQPNNAVLYHEMGKNLLAQRNYPKAYEAFEKATKLDPTNMWYYVGMYDVAYETKDFNRAITIVTKLIDFKAEYKEDLTALYMSTQQFDKALDLINELNETVGKRDMRELYKAQILKDAKYQGPEKKNLLDLIAKNPKDESNYLALILLYSDSNQEEKAFEIAKKLEKAIPESDFAQVGLFKFHVNNNEGEKAITSMKRVLGSKTIDRKIKHRVLNEFLIYSKDKPQYAAEVENAIKYFDNDPVDVSKEVAKFYSNGGDWPNVVKYYEQHLKENSDDYKSVFLLMEAYSHTGEFEKMLKTSAGMIDLFPAQPQMYYYNGLANNQLQQYKKALDVLDEGYSYVVDNPQLEINFLIQLGEAANGLGDQKKKETYFIKAEKLLKQFKK
ncbi:MAG: tetratricopeptide repeat protein [Flavobacterium sp.]